MKKYKYLVYEYRPEFFSKYQCKYYENEKDAREDYMNRDDPWIEPWDYCVLAYVIDGSFIDVRILRKAA